MTHESDEMLGVLRSVWAADAPAERPTGSDPDGGGARAKVCRNMALVSFDGMAEPGSDLRQAWRDKLAREGKLSTSGGSIRDLVLGSDDDH